jgi:hypothetical protein
MALDSVKRIFSGLLEKEQLHCSKCNHINSKESAFCSKCGAKLDKKDSSKGESKAFGLSRNMRNLGVLMLFLGLILFFIGLLLSSASLKGYIYLELTSKLYMVFIGLLFFGFLVYFLGWIIGGILVLIGKQNSK